MTKTTKLVLDRLDRIFSGRDQETARELWDVLSALRGPDDGNDGVKMMNTVPIRAAAFPKTSAKYKTDDIVVGNRAIMALDDADAYHKNSMSTRASRSGYHYRDHICKARVVLGLSLDNLG